MYVCMYVLWNQQLLVQNVIFTYILAQTASHCSTVCVTYLLLWILLLYFLDLGFFVFISLSFQTKVFILVLVTVNKNLEMQF